MQGSRLGDNLERMERMARLQARMDEIAGLTRLLIQWEGELEAARREAAEAAAA